jgi:hypothetical protein
LTPEVKQIIVSASAAAVSPRQILTLIRQTFGETPLQPRDIYNTIDKQKMDSLCGRSRLDSLTHDLTEAKWWWKMETNGKGEISHFFFATPTSIQLLRDYPEVLLMDCTYKTNRFGMPLLVVVGTTPMMTTFYAAFVFLRGETQEDYAWALARLHELYVTAVDRLAGPTTILTDRDQALSNALAAQWPTTTHLLCIWHINKAVVTNCKKHFDTNEAWDGFYKTWCETYQAATVEKGLAAWRDMIARYAGPHEASISYLEKMWLPVKQKFWVSYTSKAFTLGNRATSRAESAHVTLKAWLNTSQGDLKKVKECTELLLASQHERYKGLLAAAAIRTPHCVQIQFFQGLIGHVTPPALQFMLAQHRLAKSSREEDQKPCTNVFRTTMGLPCSHVMRERLQSNDILLPGDLHPFWLIRVSRSPASPLPRPLLNPATPSAHREAQRQQRGSRPRGAGITSTRRCECSFERAERDFDRRVTNQPRGRRQYRPTRLSRQPRETISLDGDETAARDTCEQPSQSSQQERVSEFLKELPKSNDSTLSAIAAVLTKARQAVELVDRRAHVRDCDEAIPSIEPVETTTELVSQSGGGLSAPVRTTDENVSPSIRAPRRLSVSPSPRPRPFFMPQEPAFSPTGEAAPRHALVVVSPTVTVAKPVARPSYGPSEEVLAARKSAFYDWQHAAREWLSKDSPGQLPRRACLAMEHDATVSEGEEQEDLLYEIELRRLRETGGRAQPLWSAMSAFSGFRAARQYQSKQLNASPTASRFETLSPSVDDAERPGETAAEPRRRSLRERRPSRRVRDSGETPRQEPTASTTRATTTKAQPVPTDAGSVSLQAQRASSETRRKARRASKRRKITEG